MDDEYVNHGHQLSWALDGLPIYGPYQINGDLVLPCSNPNSNASDCVDECNGHFQDIGTQFNYHYHIMGQVGDTQTIPVYPLPTIDYAPYFPACLKGVIVDEFVIERLGIDEQECVDEDYFVNSTYTAELVDVSDIFDKVPAP